MSTLPIRNAPGHTLPTQMGNVMGSAKSAFPTQPGARGPARVGSVAGEWQRGDPGEVVAAWDEDRSPDLIRFLARMLPEWHRDAACAGYPLDLFFPAVGRKPDEALAICAGCLVRDECLAEAMADETLDFGVMGGTTAKQRKAMRRATPGGTCPTSGSDGNPAPEAGHEGPETNEPPLEAP